MVITCASSFLVDISSTSNYPSLEGGCSPVILVSRRLLTNCKQKDELNKFGQDKLDNFRQHELNTLGR